MAPKDTNEKWTVGQNAWKCTKCSHDKIEDLWHWVRTKKSNCNLCDRNKPVKPLLYSSTDAGKVVQAGIKKRDEGKAAGGDTKTAAPKAKAQAKAIAKSPAEKRLEAENAKLRAASAKLKAGTEQEDEEDEAEAVDADQQNKATVEATIAELDLEIKNAESQEKSSVVKAR